MKYTSFILKLAAVGIICGILYYYQGIAVTRAEIVAENEAQIAEVEAYNREIQLENARREAEAAGAAGEEISYYYQDGTFEGTGTGYGGPITVSITLEHDVLTDVQVLSHDAEDPAYYVLAEGLTSKVLAAQSTEVDAASGATFSSKGILEAIDNALAEAENS